MVTYEVVLALQVLVTRAPHELHEPAWEAVLDVLRAVHEHDREWPARRPAARRAGPSRRRRPAGELRPRNEPLHARLHAVITSVEQLQQTGQLGGAAAALLELLDACGHERPEASALALVAARADALGPGAGWAGAALALLERYVRGDARLAVRLHALQRLLAFVRRHGALHGDELVPRVALPAARACALDAEPALRAAAARALPELARVCADAAPDLVDLLQKILDRPFDMYVSDVPVPADADVADLRLAARGLLELLHERLLRAPAAHAARAFLVLLDHLDHHYRRPAIFLHHPDVRLLIFDMIFGLRANRLNCVGFCYDERGAAVYGAAALRLRPVCSPFLLAEGPPAAGARAPPPAAGACVLPLGRAARLLVTALTREQDWAVLAHVLRALPHLLQTRALAVGRRPQDLDLLASTLCAMVSDRSLSFPDCLRGAQHKLTVSEFHSLALPPLAALAPYHAFLEPHTQQRIVRCLLKYGMGECASAPPPPAAPPPADSRPPRSAPLAAALHQRADDLHSGDARHDGQDAAGGATRPLQDLGHEADREPHAGIPVDADAAAARVRLLRGGPVHVRVRHPAAVHEPVAVQPLRGVAGAPRDRRVVPQVPPVVPPQLRALHHPRECRAAGGAGRGAGGRR